MGSEPIAVSIHALHPRRTGLRTRVIGTPALVGLWLTRFEREGAVLWFTPNRWPVLILTTLVAARIIASLWMTWRRVTDATPDAAALWLDAGAWTAVGGVFLGYGLDYTWALRGRLKSLRLKPLLRRAVCGFGNLFCAFWNPNCTFPNLHLRVRHPVLVFAKAGTALRDSESALVNAEFAFREPGESFAHTGESFRHLFLGFRWTKVDQTGRQEVVSLRSTPRARG